MKSVLKILIALFFIVFLAEDSIYAERVFTDGDLQKYGSGSSDSTSGSSDSQRENKGTKGTLLIKLTCIVSSPLILQMLKHQDKKGEIGFKPK
jgi:hypothetical protein